MKIDLRDYTPSFGLTEDDELYITLWDGDNEVGEIVLEVDAISKANLREILYVG